MVVEWVKSSTWPHPPPTYQYPFFHYLLYELIKTCSQTSFSQIEIFQNRGSQFYFWFCHSLYLIICFLILWQNKKILKYFSLLVSVDFGKLGLVIKIKYRIKYNFRLNSRWFFFICEEKTKIVLFRVIWFSIVGISVFYWKILFKFI